MIKEKYCTGCKKTHPIEEFGKLAKSADGYDYRCKAWKKANYHTPPELHDGVDKVCPTCRKHIDVNPLAKQGICKKCGKPYSLSVSWTDTNGLRIRAIKSDSLPGQIISYLENHDAAYKAQIAHQFGVHPNTIQRAVQKLKDDGIVHERYSGSRVYVEVSA